MSFNPYQPPVAVAANRDTASRVRAQAVFHLRLVWAILLLPAVYNYLAFDARAISHWLWPLTVGRRALSLLGFVVFGVLVWHVGLPALARIGQGIRQVFSPSVDVVAWNEPLYAAVHRAVYLAIFGAIPWAIVGDRLL